MKEEWRAVPGWEQAYEISSLGRVRSIVRMSPTRWLGSYRQRPGRFLRPHQGARKQLRVELSMNGYRKKYLLHHLVLFAFVGSRPRGMECRHLDGDHTNNRLDNLKWDTHPNNCQDRRRHGTAFVEFCTNTAGKTGVSYVRRLRKWHAYIGYAPRTNLGWFATKAEAIKARVKAEVSLLAELKV